MMTNTRLTTAAMTPQTGKKVLITGANSGIGFQAARELARHGAHVLMGVRDLGKGGPKHRYLQSLVKELAGQHGLMATIEAPLSRGAGQVDVLIERDGVVAAVEISVTTPVEHEKDNLRKCLACDYPRIAVVLAKSRTVQASYRAALSEIVTEGDRERVCFLTPEELPDFSCAASHVIILVCQKEGIAPCPSHAPIVRLRCPKRPHSAPGAGGRPGHRSRCARLLNPCSGRWLRFFRNMPSGR